MKYRYATVPRLVPGGTVVCVGGGPSVTRADVAACVGHVDAAIAINTAYQLVPWATVLYAADARWWRWHKGVPSFAGLKYTLSPDADLQAWGVRLLQNTGFEGLELKANGLRTGHNGGYQAINLAVHLGATRILLLGYDCQPAPTGETHWHGEHPVRFRSDYAVFRQKFQTLVAPLQAAGVEVINCSPRTALKCFPRQPVAEALARAVAA